MENRTPIQLFDDVPGGESVSVEHEFQEPATVERVWARNYINQGFDLRYKFLIERDSGRVESLFEHLGKEFLAGDDDRHDHDLREGVEAGDTLKIIANNNEPDHLYHANTHVTVDYEGGSDSGIIAAIKTALGGVF